MEELFTTENNTKDTNCSINKNNTMGTNTHQRQQQQYNTNNNTQLCTAGRLTFARTRWNPHIG